MKEALEWAKRNTPSGNEAAFLSASNARQKRVLARAIGIALLFILISGIAIELSSQLQGITQSVNPTVVTNLNDNGPGSLRWTLEHSRPGSTITFAKSGQINLTSGDLVISQNLNLRGPKGGVTIFTATGAGVPSSLRIGPGTSVTIDNLTFERSNIYNQGTLTLSNSGVSDNNTNTSGGGIYNQGTLTLINSGVYNNTTTDTNGGGIYNDVSSILTLIHSNIYGNTAGYNGGIPSSPISNPSNCRDNPPGGGGGIYNLGALTVTDSLISGNYAKSGSGGGILNTFPISANSSDLAKLTLTNSIISQNAADGDGGGIANPCPWASMNITLSPIFDNQARGNGGGIAFTTAYKGYPTLLLCNSIPEGTEGIRNSIVAGNHGKTNQDLSGIFVDACPFLSGGYNLFQNISSPSLPIKLSQTDIVVGPRANLGIEYLLTETPFIPILVAGSPAIDRIPMSACHYDGINTDQRGMKRPDDHETTCDIGAEESTP